MRGDWEGKKREIVRDKRRNAERGKEGEKEIRRETERDKERKKLEKWILLKQTKKCYNKEKVIKYI